MQLDAEGREYVPVKQLPVQAAEVKPVDKPYVPAGQAVHADAEDKENMPWAQLPVQAGLVKPVVAP